MDSIDLKFPNPLSVPEAAARVGALLSDLAQRSPYFEGVRPEWNEEGTSCRFRGEGFEGHVEVGEKEVRVGLTLSGMMLLFRSMAEQKLREMVERELSRT